MSYPNEGFTDPDSISDAGSRGSGPNLAIPQVGGFLSVENYNSELNQHTYVYDADRSFAGMTVRRIKLINIQEASLALYFSWKLCPQRTTTEM